MRPFPSHRRVVLVLAVAAAALAACQRPPERSARAHLTPPPRPAPAVFDVSDPANYNQVYARPVVLSATAPPAIPAYDQPAPPAADFLWTPGYWAWAKGDYTWIPGAWVRPPRPGLLWTPGYWRWADGAYGFVPGYWASRVGYYGGINYGHGYDGQGYVGAKWRGSSLAFNDAETNVRGLPADVVYREEQLPNTNPVGFSGGPGGVDTKPGLGDMATARSPHEPPTPAQLLQVAVARAEPGQRASVNRDRPAVAATVTPTAFEGPGAVTDAKASLPYHPPRAAARPPTASPPAP